MKTTLIIMAAGIGSRFGGGIKQLAKMGPNGEIIMDYSIYDAIRVGFDKVVFVIKEEMLKDFEDTILSRIKDKISVEIVFQKQEEMPLKTKVERIKPWGTGQALYACKDAVKENFMVLNADDFYGRDAFRVIAEFLRRNNGNKSMINDYAMAGYMVKNTLTENGAVKRGICKEENGYLTELIESNIESKDGLLVATPLEGGEEFKVSEDDTVSMNMFGFTPKLFDYLEERFPEFLDEHKDNILKCEYLIPTIVFEEINKGLARVEVLKTNAVWQGITYREDKDKVVREIKALVDKGD